MIIKSPLLVSDMYILFNAPNPNKMMEAGVVGAILMDLEILNKIEVIKNTIKEIETSFMGDIYLDGALSILSELKLNKKFEFYFAKLLKRGKFLFPLFTEHLESLNLMNLSIKRARFTYDFTVTNFNNELREEIMNELKGVLLHNNNVFDKAFMYFISILRATNSYKDIFGKEYKKQVKFRMKELLIDEPIGKMVRKVVTRPDADI
jgi:hypothetical protein